MPRGNYIAEDLMTNGGNGRRRGQALVLVTFALFAMCGLIGLAVDLGWNYYTQRAEQAAADAAAMAAVRLALNAGTGTLFCSGSNAGDCQATPVGCDSVTSTYLQAACTYANRNGYSQGGDGGRQTVTVQSGVGTPATAPGLSTYYWVTVRITTTIPQLFSAILGNTTSGVAARSTGAIVNQAITSSLILLNRANDASPTVGGGQNINFGGTGDLVANAGILMSSDAAGAGQLGGSTSVNSPFTHIRGSGTITGKTQSWNAAPTNGYGDGPQFNDPLRGKGQPALPSGRIPETSAAPGIVGWPGGTIGGGTADNPRVLHPGVYYATTVIKGQPVATGQPIQLGNGYYTFDNDGAAFGDYVFFGGLALNGSNVTFAPGRYVLGGVTSGHLAMDINNSTILQDHTSDQSSAATDAGEVFINTDLNYPGLAQSIPPLVQNISPQFTYGAFSLVMGNDASKSYVNLHGLNGSDPNLPPELKTFSPVVLWQDQGNSHVKYNSTGNVDISCPGATMDSPCTNSKVAANSLTPGVTLQAGPGMHIYGASYQPRGGWVNLQGSPTAANPLLVVTGALRIQGGGTYNLAGVPTPLTALTAALVE
jgi:hypothetical protein